MWYEILPSAAIVCTFIFLPNVGSGIANYFFQNGKTKGRFWENNEYDFHVYLRDRRITGSEYVPRGLEGVPDQPQ